MLERALTDSPSTCPPSAFHTSVSIANKSTTDRGIDRDRGREREGEGEGQREKVRQRRDRH